MSDNAETYDVKKKAVKNISYNLVGKIITSIIQFAGNIFITRLLVASDFGIYSFASIINNLLLSFNDFGINPALIQKKDINEKELNTGLIIKICLGCVIALLAIVLAPLAANFIDDKAIVNVIRVCSINFIMSAFWLVPSVLLVRDGQFVVINKISVYSTILSTVCSVLLAYNGYGYWSLVLPTLINTVIIVVMYNIYKPFKFKFSYDPVFASYIFKFGSSVFLSKVIIQVLISSDNFIVGYIAGSAQLGYYALAFNWSSMLCGIAYTSIQSVIFPTFSKYQDDLNFIKQGYIKLIKYSALLGALSYVTLFVISRDFLVGILGSGSDKWIESLPCLRIFCFYGFIRMILEPFVSICMAIGKPDIVLKANLTAIIFQTLLLYPAVSMYGLEGAAIVVTIAILIQYAVYSSIVFKTLRITMAEILKTVYPAILLVPVTLITYSDTLWSYSLINMILKIIITLVLCIYIHGKITKWELEKELYGMINR